MFSCFKVPVKNYEKFWINVLKCGHIPKHVACIMDGNRRYGKKSNMDMITTYKVGADKGFQVMDWCLLAGVEELTVYTLSIHNLDRTAGEVSTLMSILELVLRAMEQDKDKFNGRGIEIKLKGNFSIVPDNIKELVTKFEDNFVNSKKLIVNIAAFYTSRDEITTAVRDIAKSNEIKMENITEKLIWEHLLIKSDVDLLIRTSGETRLSDFLLWQTSKAFIAFENCLWPEFTFWNFIKIILKYQRHKYENLKYIISPSPPMEW